MDWEISQNDTQWSLFLEETRIVNELSKPREISAENQAGMTGHCPDGPGLSSESSKDNGEALHFTHPRLERTASEQQGLAVYLAVTQWTEEVTAVYWD